MSDIPESWMSTICFIFGMIIGSFLNVCIFRLPQNMSIVRPRSRCCHCGRMIPWYHNIPIFAWFLLRGKTACCHKPLPFRYPFVEFLTALLAVLVYNYVKSAPIAIFILICFLIVAFFTDLNHMIIPDEITLGGFTAGILCCAFYPELQNEHTALLGMLKSMQNACLAMGVLFCFLSFAEFFLKREAMGLGDVKLLACIGAFCGWQACLFAVFFGAILGTCFFGILTCVSCIKHKPRPAMNTLIPFGPFMVIATLCYLFGGKQIFIDNYLSPITFCLQ